ncbi:MAG TPA: 2-hydroxyacid dehydrogenase [Stellaceae bacterium]|nr:2-hydroxyacid dehydrogenase [Stellaceae bacterium]
MKPDIIVANPFHPDHMAALAEAFTPHLMSEARDQTAFLAALADKARGICTSVAPITAQMIAALPRLEIIAAMTVGVDHIDLAAARARSIAVTNAPDVLTDDVADLGMVLLLCVARRIVAADRYLREGHWREAQFPLANKVGGATLGILGLGRIGLAVARRAEAFGMRIVYHARGRRLDVSYPFYDNLVAMARAVDYLMVNCPGGAATRHLVNAEVIDALGKDGALINIARGSVVDEPALVKALLEGRLGGAGLDVFAEEPKVPEALFALDNVVLTPHVASGTRATRLAMGRLMVDNLLAHFSGRQLLSRCA